jgi:hypothetical protein
MGVTAPVASADVYSTYTFSVAAEGSNPVAPRFFEGFSSTVNMAGSETAEYALESVSNLYNNAGIFGCNLLSSNKRLCNTADEVGPQSDTYDNFDHNVIVQAQAIGSAAGLADICTTPSSEQPSEPSPLPSTYPYYVYPPNNETSSGADGIPVDLLRASASEADLTSAGSTVCSDLNQEAVAQDAVVGLSFPVNLTDGTTGVVDPAPLGTSINLAGGAASGGPETAGDVAWRVFCAPATDALSITTWNQLYAVLGLTTKELAKDEPLVLWGPAKNSGTGATWYEWAGCANTTGRIVSDHQITENDAQQVSQYAAQNASTTIELNTAPVAGVPAANVAGQGASSGGTAPLNIDLCGGNGTSSTGLGTSSYAATPNSANIDPASDAAYTSNEQCVAQEVADSLFFMSYGYTISHPFTAAVTIPTTAAGSVPDYIIGTNYQVSGAPTKINGSTVTGAVLGNPSAVTTDPRAGNVNAVLTGRDLWIDYLNDHVRASAAAFVNWVCDAGNEVDPKGIDLTTGQPFDTEISEAFTAWGFPRLNCDADGTSGDNTTYAPTIDINAGQVGGPIIDPGPPNVE